MVSSDVSFYPICFHLPGEVWPSWAPTLQVANMGVRGGQQGLGEQKSQGPWGCGWVPPDQAAPLLSLTR